ncbi:hypothetical protein AKJ62_03875 [candidate division MSBL1 archaeon SCGC-AAA259D14]|uniref:Uncharacterized protein n=1 Tax=candidate division MSBL1 archaeon SCGC-AAA259D14 TaxID=1698261 RepID=A0A133U4E9_9EURY|nr:hypothetical protein AKJ62_03875 [candidate division MSBL1 archaeon SCGC-AAA259D14]
MAVAEFYYRIRTGDFDVAEKGFRRQMSRCLVTKAREWHSPYYAVNQDGEVKILDPRVEEADAVGAVFGPGGAHLVRDPGLADRIRGLDIEDAKVKAWDATCHVVAEEYAHYRDQSGKEDVPYGEPFQERIEEICESLGYGRPLDERLETFLPRAVGMVKEMYADVPEMEGKTPGELTRTAYDLHRPEVSSVLEEVLHAAEYDEYYEPPFAKHGRVPTHRAQQVLLPRELEDRTEGVETILVASLHF